MLAAKHRRLPNLPLLISVPPTATVLSAVQLFEQYDVSQLPVLVDDQSVGSVNEVSLIKLFHDGTDVAGTLVDTVMGKPLPHVDGRTDVAEVYRLLLAGHGGVLVVQEGRAHGVLTRMDLVRFWSRYAEQERSER